MKLEEGAFWETGTGNWELGTWETIAVDGGTGRDDDGHMKRIGWRRVMVVAILAAALFAFGCGNPGPARGTFVFTPVPYTVVPAESGQPSFAIGVDENGSKYQADILSVLVPKIDVDDFLDWLTEAGLEGSRMDEELSDENATRAAGRGIELDQALVFVRVPLGSAPDAVDFINTWDGLEYDVSLSYFRYTQE